MVLFTGIFLLYLIIIFFIASLFAKFRKTRRSVSGKHHPVSAGRDRSNVDKDVSATAEEIKSYTSPCLTCDKVINPLVCSQCTQVRPTPLPSMDAMQKS